MSTHPYAVIRAIAFSAAVMLAAPLTSRPAAAQSEQQALVDRATLSVQDIVGPADAKDAKSQLRQARAVQQQTLAPPKGTAGAPQTLQLPKNQ